MVPMAVFNDPIPAGRDDWWRHAASTTGARCIASRVDKRQAGARYASRCSSRQSLTIKPMCVCLCVCLCVNVCACAGMRADPFSGRQAGRQTCAYMCRHVQARLAKAKVCTLQPELLEDSAAAIEHRQDSTTTAPPSCDGSAIVFITISPVSSWPRPVRTDMQK